jgi:hypothetical protein
LIALQLDDGFVLDTKTFASVLPHLIVLLPSQNKAKRSMERRTQMLWSLRWAEFVGRLFLQESKKQHLTNMTIATVTTITPLNFVLFLKKSVIS